MLSVRRRPGFDDQGADLAGSVQRLDEVLAGLEWIIANDPEYYDSIPYTSLRVARTREFPDVPLMRVYYSVELQEDCCTLEWIRASSITATLRRGCQSQFYRDVLSPLHVLRQKLGHIPEDALIGDGVSLTSDGPANTPSMR